MRILLLSSHLVTQWTQTEKLTVPGNPALRWLHRAVIHMLHFVLEFGLKFNIFFAILSTFRPSLCGLYFLFYPSFPVVGAALRGCRQWYPSAATAVWIGVAFTNWPHAGLSVQKLLKTLLVCFYVFVLIKSVVFGWWVMMARVVKCPNVSVCQHHGQLQV